MNVNKSIHETRSEILKSILKNRRSVRQFTTEPIESKDLTSILEAGIYAPSGSNAQNQRFLVIDNATDKNALGKIRFVWPYPSAEKMRQKKNSGLIGGASVVIVVFANAALSDHRENGEYYIWESLEIQNCAASIENMLNMATALGIGSCWLSASEQMTRTRLLNEKSWASALAKYDVPSWYKIQGIIILGYPNGGFDENGYPKGEKKHGASVWASTNREKLDHYLIGKKSFIHEEILNPLNGLQTFKLRLFSKISGVLLKLLKIIDHNIYDLEVKLALKKIYQSKDNIHK